MIYTIIYNGTCETKEPRNTEKKSENLNTERQLPKLTRSKTKAILDKGNLDKIARQKEALGKIIKGIEELKIQSENEKLQDGTSIEDVQKWGADIEGEIDDADSEISYLNQYLAEAEAVLHKSCGYAGTIREEGFLYVRSLRKVSTFSQQISAKSAGSRNKKPILNDIICIFCNLKALIRIILRKI